MAKLSYFIDLHGVELADKGLTWLHTFPVGTYQHPVYGELELTSERLQNFVDSVKNKTRKIDLDVDYDHKADVAKGSKAAGWIRDAELREDGMWIGVELTANAKKEVEDGEWRYLSPNFDWEWTDDTGVTHKDVLFGAALTNRPFLKDLLPIAASEDYIETLRPKSPKLHDGYFKVGDRVKVVGEGHAASHTVGTIKEIGGRAYGVMFDGAKEVHHWYADGELAPENPVKGEMFYSELASMIATAIISKRGAGSGV